MIAQNGFVDEAFEIFKQTQLEGVKPVSTSFASILSACAKMGELERGMEIHHSIVKSGLLFNVVESALVDMYAKCKSIYDASEVFDEMQQRDDVSWNAMIAGYAQIGFVEKALETSKQIQSAGVKPDSSTFVIIIQICATMGALEHGINIHQRIVKSNFFSDVVASALVDMDAKCGSMH
ncbi:putative pentatricopeptide repeat-containing protein At1g68930 [Cryptomeria japonica]|uniref:putative pentatricopeptide repeat-containing protein At1g68930 n=1 Tax=Cryptomeria japonica TaxID=3369 RepID=UPI0027D9D2F1|nr:putative pentatricopeptide repeat-containing protein At1g68930 [Cryptomeria japonica]